MNDRQTTYLVLITGEFPSKTGDYSFIQHEIDEVASRFDHVLIYSFKPLTGPPADLPENVSYVGALCSTPRRGAVFALLSPTRAAAGLRALAREVRSGRFRGHAGLVLGNILTGERFARAIDRELRAAGVTRKSQVSVYSFWASHGALALPFLPRRFYRVMRLHRFDLYDEVGGWLPLRASLFASVGALLPISDDGYRYLNNRFGELIPNGTMSVLRLGTADHGLGPIPTSFDSRDDEHAICVVSCSSVIDVKRVEAIVPALELLARHHSVQWTHFGSGARMPSLEAAARDAQTRVPNLSIELHGQTDNNEILAYYRTEAIDVFVNVSDSEGVPVSIMEALSFGIPVVATDVGGTGEIVSVELGSGALLPPRPEEAALAEAILSVVRRRESLAPRLVWERLSDARVSAAQIADLLETT